MKENRYFQMIYLLLDNYVVINGRCYTDIHKVRSMALEALQEVAIPTDAYFPLFFR